MASIPPDPSFQSNYPRGQAAGLAYTRPPGVYFDTIGTAFDMIKADWGVYVACSLVVMAVYMGLAFTSSFLTVSFGPRAAFVGPMDPISLIRVLVPQLVLQFATQFMGIGLIGVGVRHAMGHWPSIPDLFLPFKRFGRTSAAVGVLLIPTAIYDVIWLILAPTYRTNDAAHWVPLIGFGVMVLIFWLLISGPLYLGAAAATFSDLPPIEAYRQAFIRTRWAAPLLSLLLMVAGIVSGLGFLACCIGIIFTLPISTNVIALHYTYYFPPQAPANPAPFNPGPVNPTPVNPTPATPAPTETLAPEAGPQESVASEPAQVEPPEDHQIPPAE